MWKFAKADSPTNILAFLEDVFPTEEGEAGKTKGEGGKWSFDYLHHIRISSYQFFF